MVEKISPEVHAAYERIHQTDEFAELKRSYRRFIFPATIGFMVWYLMYVVASNWAPGFMNIQLFGNINVALVWGLLQFVTTFLLAFAYAKYAAKNMDPIADSLNEGFDSEVGR